MAYETPIYPPADWFDPPTDGIPTDKRITIDPTGRVYGYIALWNTCHAGIGGCVRPPKGSPTSYEYAHQGETVTASGDMIRTAVIGGGAGHAPLDSPDPVSYYENTGTQLMRVRYGEDQHGLWLAGALWPDANELDVARIRASSISGDWRWNAAWRHTASGGYDFAGACLVNIPGYPMPADGHIGAQAGKMKSIAASSYVPFDGDGIVFDGDQFYTATNITGEDTVECTGNVDECGCSPETCTASVEQETPDPVESEPKPKKKKKDAEAPAAVEDPAPVDLSDPIVYQTFTAALNRLSEERRQEIIADVYSAAATDPMGDMQAMCGQMSARIDYLESVVEELMVNLIADKISQDQ